MPRKALEMIAWAGVVYRTTSYDEPLWVNPNRRHGRWNIAGQGCTQYACLDAAAPYAEALRAQELHTEEEVATYRTTLWQLRIDEGAIVDYSTFDLAEAAGFPPAALVDEDHEACQVEATRVRSLGARGLLSPCAALPGSINLTLFGPRLPIEWDAQVVLASTIPAQRLAQGGASAGLVDRVRHYGTPHAGLEEYKRSRMSG